MGTTYATYESRIRADLSDSGNPPLLSAADLDRHIDHAARDLSIIAPLDLLYSLTIANGSRTQDLSALYAANQVLRLIAVEWPIAQYPQEFIQYSLFGPQLTMLVEQAPDTSMGADYATANVYASVAMVAGATSAASTIPPQYDDILILGAEGYAAQQLATRLMNMINIGGPVVWEHYLTLSDQLLVDFNDELRKLAAQTQIFSRRLYAPEYPPQGISQTEVYPPEQMFP